MLLEEKDAPSTSQRLKQPHFHGNQATTLCSCTRLLSLCFLLKVRLATPHTSLLLVSDERMQGKQRESLTQCSAPSRASNTSISHGVTYPSGIPQDAVGHCLQERFSPQAFVTSLLLILSHTDALALIRIELLWQRGAKIKSSPWPPIYIKLVRNLLSLRSLAYRAAISHQGGKLLGVGKKGAKTTLTLFSQGEKARRKGFITELGQLPCAALGDKKSR